MKDEMARAVFDSLVRIQVGRGDKVRFWMDRWIEGRSVSEIAPAVFQLVPVRRRNSRTVQEALMDSRWTLDLVGELPMEGFVQCVELCAAILQVERDIEVEDQFTWPCSSSGQYTARSTYARLCQGGERFAAAACIWEAKAPLKCKIFQWLAIRGRLWTTVRRAKHGLQEVPNACFVCLQELDSVEHILIKCAYAREVWHRSFCDAGLPDLAPTVEDELGNWWLRVRVRFQGKEQRQFDSRVILTSWMLWKHRNARAFNNVKLFASPMELVHRIKEEASLWELAGVGVPLRLGE